MANKKHLEILKQGVDAWNQWRWDNRPTTPDLSGADLRRENLFKAHLWQADLRKIDLREANLSDADFFQSDLIEAKLTHANLRDANFSSAKLVRADLRKADLSGAGFQNSDLGNADLSGANLIDADFSDADLWSANLSGADLRKAAFCRSNLNKANLSGANLSGANLWMANLMWSDMSGATLRKAFLSEARLIKTNIKGATLSDSNIYGISVWNVKIDDTTTQFNLEITDIGESSITVDNLEVAQFIYLLLNNEKVRSIINTITTKVVLILGRFTPERKAILDAIRKELRNRNYLPILFDFEKPSSRDITETISILAHMSRFIIVDITDAKCIPQELQQIVPNLPSVPIVPLLLSSEKEYSMFEHFKRYPWVLDIYIYQNQEALLDSLAESIIGSAEAMASQLLLKCTIDDINIEPSL